MSIDIISDSKMTKKKHNKIRYDVEHLSLKIYLLEKMLLVSIRKDSESA